jgi:adenylate cyclase
VVGLRGVGSVDGVVSRTTAIVVVVALASPVAGLVLLLSSPSADPHWDHQPSHFWLVLGAAATAAVLAWAVGASAMRRSDARLLLVSMAFGAAAAFLGLHALATPRVLLSGSNQGFVVAVPVGLALAAGFAVWSAIPLDGERGRWIVRHALVLRAGLPLVVLAWATWSLTELAPLDDPTPVESGSTVMLLLGVPTTVGLLAAAWQYLRLARRRRAVLLVAVAAAWALLAESSIAVSFTENWRVSWWEWHVLMVAAFAAIALAASRMPEYERFSDMYLDDVAGGTRPVSVVFADLEGFTKFSEQHPPDVVRRMLNTYLEAVLPQVRSAGGRIDRLIGDAVMVTFNVSTDQPDHAARAVDAALQLQAAAAEVAKQHPEWPRFRAGVNTGEAVVGLLGDAAERDYTVLGDTVNVAAHIEGLAPVGAVAISDATRRAVPGARVVSLGTVQLKTRAEQIEIWRVDGLDGLDGRSS